MTIGSYHGAIAPAFNDPKILSQLTNISRLLQSGNVVYLSKKSSYVVRLVLSTNDGDLPVAVKSFQRQHMLKDWYDHRYKSKAERSFLAAMHLQNHHIGTPAPIAWLDLWQGRRLLESYYVCLFESGVCLRDCLTKIYYETGDNEEIMQVLHVVAPAIKAMHDTGFMHGDMGNQNILLPEKVNGQWGKPQFIDLNRSIIQPHSLDFDHRAFDLSRISLPDAYRKIFKMIYCNHEYVPTNLEQQEFKYRRRFEWHRRSRPFRRPIDYLKKYYNKPKTSFSLSPQDIWLWDEKTSQPMVILSRKEKHHYRDWGHIFIMIGQGLISVRGVFRCYHQVLARSYQNPVTLTDRIGVALHPKAEYIEQELSMLNHLGNPPVLIRFCHHEKPADWQKGIELVEYLHQQGIEVMVAILQDRKAITHPEKWADFLCTVIHAIADKAAHIEITHAGNRVKWGIWSAKEYTRLMEPAFELQEQYPHIKLTGPACIDFEYQAVFAALKAIPKGKKLSALSHFLYVDRRGAPENRQGKFSTLEKCALLKALAQWSNRCADKVIISEVNWPIKYTGIWSPIGCPYETPGWRQEPPGITEDDYANYMLRYIVIALCSGHVEQIFWWRLSAHGYGLVDDKNNFSPRPAFTALAFFLQLLGNAIFVRKQTHAEGIHAFEFRTRGRKIVMVWSHDVVSTVLPLTDYTQALNKEGTILTEISLSGSPIYLLYELS